MSFIDFILPDLVAEHPEVSIMLMQYASFMVHYFETDIRICMYALLICHLLPKPIYEDACGSKVRMSQLITGLEGACFEINTLERKAVASVPL